MDLSELNYIKYASKQSRISNAYKKWIGQDIGLRKKEALEKKINLEKNWISKNPANQNILDKLFLVEGYSIFLHLFF